MGEGSSELRKKLTSNAGENHQGEAHNYMLCVFANLIHYRLQVIAGKGHETYLIQGDKKEFFDDREECRDALKYVNVLRQAG
ncbi:UDP-N-acetylmuramoyl-L-alanyl-D-glutamate--2,6-diaminopimelate ligase-like [Gossypium australe]|uniref:UDP-N-acetylmuramoyl-L-alanyl-D-glutamate--2, 6-diaminopimelate ligase-like n=1 Tax=Gossypium australe TaxID=47621 RepID=A0A5B6UJ90_9ROSI|nr:UDP-N-acetylmuramoyl-L-alanyl-D-glutamate--2,6-diaminopimelate ligase-like [Gossypium australe]